MTWSESNRSGVAVTGYDEFLHGKAAMAPVTGFEVDPDEIHPLLKPHQRDVVRWAVAGGRRALFESFGLGKTMQQLEIERLVLDRMGGGRGLIVCPLAVRQEFVRDGQRLGLKPTFIRNVEEAQEDGIYLTNYETVREGKLDPRAFNVVSLDEAAVLRGFGGTKTFRQLMGLYEGTAAYRFVATATPSPNDYIELLAYAAFLDILDVGQAKTRFFKRDSEHADQLTLLPHMEHEFWMWVASWAVFLQKPSDLGYSDDGYELPPVEVVWHQVPAAKVNEARFERDGRGELFRDAGRGVVAAAAEKRESVDARVAKMAEVLSADPDDHFVLWHDLERERHAIARTAPDAVSVWGSQDLEERERSIVDFSEGRIKYLSTKPVIAGSGCNFQRHCHRAVFVGVGHKFKDFIQAIHRLQRFQQPHPVRIDIIYTEAEAAIRTDLETKWAKHNLTVARMTDIIREYGLAHESIDGGLRRAMGVDRQAVTDEGYELVLNDSVIETAGMETGSVDLIVTSIPFSSQYEYSPSFNDFGHNESNAAFWQQMDFLTPELVRVLQPGRIAAIHVKDRIVPGGLNGLGFRTLHPFHAEALEHYTGHGLAFLGMITVVTDVVRENNQTYRLGYSEQCKDGSPMGVGVPEYVLVLRKPPTDSSNGYADAPITKDKTDYSLGRWQVDAHGYWRSDGDRLLAPEDLFGLTHQQMFRLFRDHHLEHVYDYEAHVALCDHLREEGKLPVDFMLLQPPSWSPDVWTDVARMRTLNTVQAQRAREQHLCPLPFDIVKRLIGRYSNEGDLVLDPFAGLGTVPLEAVRAGRRGIGIELNPVYFLDSVRHLEDEARKHAMPTLFDTLGAAA